MISQLVLVALAGVALGAGLVWLITRGQKRAAAKEAAQTVRAETDARLRELEEERTSYRTQTASLERRLEEAQHEIEAVRERAEALATQKAAVHQANTDLKKRLKSEEQRLETLEERFQAEFESLAGKLLEEKSEKFTKTNEQKLGQLLAPLKKKLDRFEKEVRDNREKSIEARTALQERITQLTTLNQQLSQDAADLTEALEGQSKTQGDWGEMILERILEDAGLNKGREFTVQETVTGADGTSGRPDAVVKLPGERFIVIDAKVSIKAYRQCVSADSEEDFEAAAKAHLRSVRSHVSGLASKSYHGLHGSASPDFVLMFVPVEPAFALALRRDEALYNDAFSQNIVLVSPTTLLATMATVSNIWKHENRSRNAQEIARRGGRLYDKFVLFAEALEDVGNSLESAQASYDTAFNRLTQGRGNLVRQAEMLRELGADTDKEMPPNLEEFAAAAPPLSE